MPLEGKELEAFSETDGIFNLSLRSDMFPGFEVNFTSSNVWSRGSKVFSGTVRPCFKGFDSRKKFVPALKTSVKLLDLSVSFTGTTQL